MIFEKDGHREWQIPASEHRMAEASLSRGRLTLSYVDFESHEHRKEEIFGLDQVNSLQVMLGMEPSLEEKVKHYANLLLREALTLMQDKSPSARERDEKITEELEKIDRDLDMRGKPLGAMNEGLLFWVIRLEMFKSVDGFYGNAYVLPKGHVESEPKFST
jgi:hypothetical protein